MSVAMPIARYLTHPRVPVPRKGCSARGHERAEMLRLASWIGSIRRIVSRDDETKAIETAEIVARSAGANIEMREQIGENNCSSTGFLPPTNFEAVADKFVAAPDQSARGWVTALAEQARIVTAIGDVLKTYDGGDVLFVGHGAVGAVNLCRLLGVPISRTLDQPGGGGNVYA